MAALDYELETRAVLNPDRVMQGLTVKQEEYAQARFMHATPAEAYRLAYDCSGSTDKSIARQAWTLDHDVRIVARVRQLTVERNARSSLAPSLSRDFVLNGIMEIAMMGQKESNRLNAYVQLGKTVGIDLFRDVHVTERRERSADEIDAELKARLEALQNGMRTIEGASRPAESVQEVLKPVPAGTAKDRRRKPAPR